MHVLVGPRGDLDPRVLVVGVPCVLLEGALIAGIPEVDTCAAFERESVLATIGSWEFFVVGIAIEATLVAGL